MSKPRILLWDLEILRATDIPSHKWFGVSNYPGRTMGADINSIICFGYKWLGEGKADSINAWDFPGWEESVNDDGEVVAAAHALFAEADAIVTHYGKKFDLKFYNARAMFHGFPPLPKMPHIDTQIVASRNLRLFSNKLDEVASFFGLETKLSTTPQLWDGVRYRDIDSMNKMAEYCAQDVEVLEQVYTKLLPLASGVPNYNLFTGEDLHVCPKCGSINVHKHGTKVTATTKLQRFQCQDCGAVSTAGKTGKLMRAV